MLDTALRLIDYLIQFVAVREADKRVFFDRYVEPTYVAAEQVFSDFIAVLHEARGLAAQQDVDLDELIAYLEKARLKYLPVRAKLKELASSQLYDEQFSSILHSKEEGKDAFSDGILELVRGGVCSVETEDRYDVRQPGGGGGHSIAAVIQSIRSMKTAYERLQETGRIDPEQAAGFILNSRNGLVRGIDERIDGLRLAWSRVVEGYAAHLNRTLPSPKTSRRPRETK